MKSKLHVTVTIKVADSICYILFLKLPIAVFTKVLAYLTAVKVPDALPVDPLKSGIRLKIDQPCDALPLTLHGYLSLTQMLQ